MAYITIDDIPKVLAAKLTKMGLPGCEPDLSTEIAKHDLMMGGIINSKLAARYAVPFSPVPGIIKFIALHLVIHSMFAQQQKTGEEYQEQYDFAMSLLDNIAKGETPVFDDATGLEVPINNTTDSPVEINEGNDYDYIEEEYRVFPRTAQGVMPSAFQRTLRPLEYLRG